MKIKYDQQSDILTIILREAFPVNSISEPGELLSVTMKPMSRSV